MIDCYRPINWKCHKCFIWKKANEMNELNNYCLQCYEDVARRKKNANN